MTPSDSNSWPRASHLSVSKNKNEFSAKKPFFIEKEKLRFIDVFQLLTGEEFKARGICIDRNFFMARE